MRFQLRPKGRKVFCFLECVWKPVPECVFLSVPESGVVKEQPGS